MWVNNDNNNNNGPPHVWHAGHHWTLSIIRDVQTQWLQLSLCLWRLQPDCPRLEVKAESQQMCYFNTTFFGVVLDASPRPAEVGAAAVTGLASPRRNMTLLRVTTAEKSRSGNSLHITAVKLCVTIHRMSVLFGCSRPFKQEALLMQMELCEHTVSCNRLRPNIVDNSRPIWQCDFRFDLFF